MLSCLVKLFRAEVGRISSVREDRCLCYELSVSRLCGTRGSGYYALHSTWRAWKHVWRVRLPETSTLAAYSVFFSDRNPLGCAVAMTALDVLVEENLSQRAEVLGEKFRTAIRAINSPLVKTVRGRGLLNAVVIDEESSRKGRTAWQFCLLLKSRGVLAKPTHVNMYVALSRNPVNDLEHWAERCLSPFCCQYPLRPSAGHFRIGPDEGGGRH